jgi:hypothetical protein
VIQSRHLVVLVEERRIVARGLSQTSPVKLVIELVYFPFFPPLLRQKKLFVGCSLFQGIA